jgi:hypothetical protein
MPRLAACGLTELGSENVFHAQFASKTFVACALRNIYTAKKSSCRELKLTTYEQIHNMFIVRCVRHDAFRLLPTAGNHCDHNGTGSHTSVADSGPAKAA